MKLIKTPSNLCFIGDCKVHCLKSKTQDGEQAYMFYVLVPGPICKMYFLFMNKMNITRLGIWSDNYTPISQPEWIGQLRNVITEEAIKKDLVQDAERFQSMLVKLELLKRGKR